MSANIVLVENRGDWKPQYPGAIVVPARDYVGQPEYHKLKDVRVINLCRSYRYLSIGYYCSLLAEARHHRIIPSVRTVTDLSSRTIYGVNIEDIDDLVQKSLKKKSVLPGMDTFEMAIFFGECEHKELQKLAYGIFDLFPCPLMKVDFRFQEKWHISAIRPHYINAIIPEREAFFANAFNSFLSRRWHSPKAKKVARYDLAILRNVTEPLPPSNLRALHRFMKVGEKLRVNVELIEKKDYSRIAEYDMLFIRETTRIDHYTYRFAKKAESEGIIVIDDPNSIVKCTNKVYLTELLSAKKVQLPKTIILQKNDIKGLKSLEQEIDYPIVLKIPDGSFSRGVFKADNYDELQELTSILFKQSDLILAQEFLYTDFDWRIGILNYEPIFACQYFMSKRHWQIVKHTSSGRFTGGDFKTWPVEEVPEEVVQAALKAANLIGDGLYGVDLKQTDKGVFVIEVNDNPNIDAGVEDACLGDELYRRIIEDFIRRVEALL